MPTCIYAGTIGSDIIDKDSLVHVIESIISNRAMSSTLSSNPMQADMGKYLTVKDAFESPQYIYDPERKTFSSQEPTPSLFPAARWKNDELRNRYYTILQRIERAHKTQVRPQLTSNLPDCTQSIERIKNLNGKKPGVYKIFGMLTSMQSGLYFLEDLDSTIELHFPETVCIFYTLELIWSISHLHLKTYSMIRQLDSFVTNALL